MRLESKAVLESPEELQRRLGALACERQRLRESVNARESLERNRVEIVRHQYELSHALVKRYLRSVESAAWALAQGLRFVQLRRLRQLEIAAVRALPVRGVGEPLTIVAGTQV